MTPPRSRALLIASALVLVAVAVAWLVWPQSDRSADLEPVASVATTTTRPATTTPPPSDPTGPTSTTTTAPPPVVPVRVRIPSIGLDAAVVPVAQRLDGQMEVPPAADVGWYRLGPAPGQTGSAVLAAHIDFEGKRGAFFDLRSIAPGAEVFVDGGGGTKRFIVSGREQVAKDAVQLDRYFTAQGPARVTLITCGGAFEPGARHYRDNIIVTADLAP